MAISSEQLKILLIGANIITPDKFDEALKSAEQENVAIETYLPQNGLIQDNHLGQIIANYLKVNYIDLQKEPIEPSTQQIIPEPVAKNKQAIAFKQDENTVYVATTNPSDYEFLSLLKKKTGKEIVTFYATPLSIGETLKNYRTDVNVKAAELIKVLQTKQNASDNQNENALIEFVDLFLESAYDKRASDIHIEPMKKRVSLRLRIDGVLHELLTYPKEFHENIVSRIKILAKLSIDEHDAAQDGRFSYKKGTSDFDVRVSILPATGCDTGCGAQTTDEACVNLSGIGSNYLGAVPQDPKTGVAAETDYYIMKDTNGAITVGACDAEGEGAGGGDAAPTIETIR